MSDKSLEEFRRYVENCRKKQLPDVIENASVAYATILLQNLLIFAKEKEKKQPVKFVSGCLLPTAFDHLVDDAKAALDSGVHIDVITMRPESDLVENAFYKLVHSHARGRTASLNKDDLESEQHFCIADDTAYRLEMDNQTGTALASFNDNNGLVVPRLKARFEKLWAEATRGGNNGRDGTIGVH